MKRPSDNYKKQNIRMKTTGIFCCMLLLHLAISGQNSLSRVSVEGNKFMVNDTMIIFHGVNTSDPEKLTSDGHWNEEYFKEIKSWGANLVRFPVHPAAWRKVGKDAYLQMLDKGIKYAGDLGMYVVIDWHSIGNLCLEKYQAPSYITTKKETLDFWDVISNKYKDNTTVAFFELYNEPTVSGERFGNCSWSDWKKINEQMIKTIRKNGAKTIPLVAGFNWAYDLTPIADDPIDAEGIAYVSHPYPMKRQKPWEPQWTADWGFAAKKYPVILTEIGYCGKDDRGAHVPVISDDSYGDAITQYTRENNISYVVWVFDPQWAPMMIENWDFTPTMQGRYFKKALGQR
jgi:hypothetical protein